MKQKPSSFQCPELNPNFTLTSDEHEILLGILKKVEAKNGAMITFWALIITALVAISLVFGSSDNFGPLRATASLLILGALPFLLCAVAGTRQVDNFSYPLTEKGMSFEKVTILMQKELMADLLQKEEYFYATRVGAIIYLVVCSILHACYFVKPLVSLAG